MNTKLLNPTPTDGNTGRLGTWRSCLLVAASAAIVGCGGGADGPSRAAVSGMVTLDARPLSTGVIRFVPDGQTGGPKTSAKITNGRFALPEEYGPVVGRHRIEIESSDDGGYPRDDESVLKRLQAEGKRFIQAVRVPDDYNDNSQLAAQIAPDGENRLTFDLQSHARRRSR